MEPLLPNKPSLKPKPRLPLLQPLFIPPEVRAVRYLTSPLPIKFEYELGTSADPSRNLIVMSLDKKKQRQLDSLISKIQAPYQIIYDISDLTIQRFLVSNKKDFNFFWQTILLLFLQKKLDLFVFESKGNRQNAVDRFLRTPLKKKKKRKENSNSYTIYLEACVITAEFIVQQYYEAEQNKDSPLLPIVEKYPLYKILQIPFEFLETKLTEQNLYKAFGLSSMDQSKIHGHDFRGMGISTHKRAHDLFLNVYMERQKGPFVSCNLTPHGVTYASLTIHDISAHDCLETDAIMCAVWQYPYHNKQNSNLSLDIDIPLLYQPDGRVSIKNQLKFEVDFNNSEILSIYPLNTRVSSIKQGYLNFLQKPIDNNIVYFSVPLALNLITDKTQFLFKNHERLPPGLNEQQLDTLFFDLQNSQKKWYAYCKNKKENIKRCITNFQKKN